jgi:ribosomal protein S18 acetylase RimI-like enzyme
MRLTPFDPAHAATVAAWAGSAAEVLAWCSHPRSPVPPEVVAGWGGQDGVRAFSLRDDDGAPVAYGEVWTDDDEAETELARLIVDPARRGRGVGRELVARLTERARRTYPAVFMRVRPDNAPALRCYAAAGYVRVPPADEAAFNRGQPSAYAWLAYAGS